MRRIAIASAAIIAAPLSPSATNARSSPPRRHVLIGFLLVTSLMLGTSAAAATVGWELMNPKPLARTGHALAYDSARSRTVLFGGLETRLFADTWEWDGLAWADVTPSTSPPARYASGLVYDNGRDRLVLFGGFGANGDLADTWERNGTEWVNVTPAAPAASPPARERLALAYDSARGRVVLFGGSDPNHSFADTWEWDGSAWIEVTPATSPPARSGHALAYDSARGRTVLFGGWDGNQLFTDTWEWDGSAWTNVTPATNPAARYGDALAYDAARGRVVLFGGWDRYNLFADTWEWDGAAWTNVTPAASPPARFGHALAYDTARGRVVLFGGPDDSQPAYRADTWEWDGATWKNRTPATSPSPRSGHALGFDSARERTVLFGGATPWKLADTWEWNGAAWKRLEPPISPPARAGHAMAYDSARGRVVLFGGNNGIDYLADTWEWDGTAWLDVTPAVSPSARSAHAMAYDSARGRVVLFGGGSNWHLADTWEWDGSAWVNVTPAVSPTARAGHALAFDSARGRVVMFGGNYWFNGGHILADTWEWDGTAWLDVTPASSPFGRVSALAYDSARNRAVLFGGGTGSGIPDDGTWEWDGTAWADVTPATGPFARSGHAMAFDGARSRVVLFGGYNGINLGDTWEYGPPVEKICDGLDDNGDGAIDEHCDDDLDGYCDDAMTVVGSPAICPEGGGDCNDRDAALHPGAKEICDGLDNDCDGPVDEIVYSQVCGTCQTGLPGVCSDGTLGCAGGHEVCPPCSQPGLELCDNLDNDCDGQVDEGLGSTTCGTGVCQVSVLNCIGGTPQACTPGAPSVEVCNGLDDDCDGSVPSDEVDADADGFMVCAGDNCIAVYNPGQENSDGRADGGDACDMSITSPLGGSGLCTNPPPTIRWSTENYDRFRVYVSWDLNFKGAKTFSSGDTWLRSPSWTPMEKKWTRGCTYANPHLYLRVCGKVAGTKTTECSDAVQLSVK